MPTHWEVMAEMIWTNTNRACCFKNAKELNASEMWRSRTKWESGKYDRAIRKCLWSSCALCCLRCANSSSNTGKPTKTCVSARFPPNAAPVGAWCAWGAEVFVPEAGGERDPWADGSGRGGHQRSAGRAVNRRCFTPRTASLLQFDKWKGLDLPAFRLHADIWRLKTAASLNPHQRYIILRGCCFFPSTGCLLISFSQTT